MHTRTGNCSKSAPTECGKPMRNKAVSLSTLKIFKQWKSSNSGSRITQKRRSWLTETEGGGTKLCRMLLRCGASMITFKEPEKEEKHWWYDDYKKGGRERGLILGSNVPPVAFANALCTKTSTAREMTLHWMRWVMRLWMVWWMSPGSQVVMEASTRRISREL